ncbi:hypothetical protein N325_08209, partial [Colius striatus]
DTFYHAQLHSLGLRDARRVTEEETGFRGWLVRRVCGLLAVWGWKDTPRDLRERICSSKRVQDVAVSSGEARESPQWKEKVLEILAEIQAPLSLFMLRLCHWALLKLLGCIFHSVQLPLGQLATVLRATRRAEPQPPSLVFMATRRSQLDGLLLSFILFSQGLGVPRVTMDSQAYSPLLQALLRRLGGIFLPSGMGQMPNEGEGLPEAVLAVYIEELLRSQQPLLIFLEQPTPTMSLSASEHKWLSLLCHAARDGASPNVLLVPVGIAYDVAPGAWQRGDAQPLGLGACVWTLGWALRRSFGCVRVDLAQPFSLKEFVDRTLCRQDCAGRPLKELLVPSVLGLCPNPLDVKKAESWGLSPASASALEAEEMLVTMLGLHCLSGEGAAGLGGERLWGASSAWLMQDFAWLMDEVLLRQQELGFSGQLRAVMQHSLALLTPCLTFYRLPHLGDMLVVPRASADALRELGHHSTVILPVLAREAVGACAIQALLREMLPFLEPTTLPSAIVLSQAELHRKTLELLWLLPP